MMTGPCSSPFAIELLLFDFFCPEEFSLIKQHSSILVKYPQLSELRNKVDLELLSLLRIFQSPVTDGHKVLLCSTHSAQKPEYCYLALSSEVQEIK